jgi:hypothetical protein
MTELNKLVLRYLVVHALIAVATLFVLVPMPLYFNEPTGLNAVAGDLHVYRAYAKRALAGAIPYYDFRFEYPPLAFLAILLPWLFGEGFRVTAFVIAAEGFVSNAVAVWLIAGNVQSSDGIAEARRRLSWYTGYLACFSLFAYYRIDLIAMAVTLAAVLAWRDNAVTRGALLVAAGTFLKFFPALVTGPLILRDLVYFRPSRLRGALVFLAALAAGFSAWWLVGGDGVLYCFRFHTERGLEINSLYSGLLTLLGRLTGASMLTAGEYNSAQLVHPWSEAALALAGVIQPLAVLLVLVLFATSGFREPMRYCGAIILAFSATGKVLSPQYLIWLMPFVALLPGPRGAMVRRLFLAASVITILLFPTAFGALCNFHLVAVSLLNIRNAILLLLLVLWLLKEERIEAIASRLRDWRC